MILPHVLLLTNRGRHLSSLCPCSLCCPEAPAPHSSPGKNSIWISVKFSCECQKAYDIQWSLKDESLFLSRVNVSVVTLCMSHQRPQLLATYCWTSTSACCFQLWDQDGSSEPSDCAHPTEKDNVKGMLLPFKDVSWKPSTLNMPLTQDCSHPA